MVAQSQQAIESEVPNCTACQSNWKVACLSLATCAHELCREGQCVLLCGDRCPLKVARGILYILYHHPLDNQNAKSSVYGIWPSGGDHIG